MMLSTVRQDNEALQVADQLIVAAGGPCLETFPPILNRKEVGPAPLSFAQERLWFLDQINPGDASSNISRAVRIKGDLKLDLLQRSLQAVVSRHESLRTTFTTSQLHAVRDSKPVQLIAANKPLEIPVIDLSSESLDHREAKARGLARSAAQRSFDLTLGPLMRVTLLRLADREHVLVLNLHRIVCDEASLQILIEELWAAYSALATGVAWPTSPVQIQYADYAAWQRQLIDKERLKPAVDFWRANLQGAPAMIELPTDRLKPPVQTWHGESVSLSLEKELVQQLRQMATREDVTLPTVLLAALNVVLARHSRQDDIVVGCRTPNRDDPAVKHLIGPLCNWLSLRTSLSDDPAFCVLCARVQKVMLEAQAYRVLPFEKLLEELQLERSLSHGPVFQVTFNMEEATGGRTEAADLQLEDFQFDDGITRSDLMVEVLERASRLDCSFRYNKDLFDVATIERLSEHFKTVLEGIAGDPDQRVSALPLLTAPERKQILVDWNNTETGFAQELSISQLFEAQVELSPEATAAIFGTERLSYDELNRRANQLAHYLRRLSAGPEAKVGICIGRGLEMAIGVLAVLKAGAAYVPLDPAYPAERLRFMIEDADIAILLTDSPSGQNLPDRKGSMLWLDRESERFACESELNPCVRTEPENLAYVIYTSGSTGQPKGVAMTHQALANLLAWHMGKLSAARTLQFASLSFDVSFQEMFSAWCSGGTLVLITEEVRQDPHALMRFIEAERIERLFLPFVFLQHLAEIRDGDELPSRDLREVITAGEQLEITPQIARFFRSIEGVTLHNHYGPSETHVVTTYELCGAVTGWPKLPPIGRPISHTKVYIVDENAQPVPIGVSGELCLGGIALSRGYLNRPGLTAEKYAPDPFGSEPGARVYRTGDLARFLPDGNIEFLGRIDSQVKIRGYRIEPGEIEAVLREHSFVRDVAVVARQGKLVAYVVADAEDLRDGAKLWSELRGFIKARLPEYMSPASFVALDALPLTPSGKVDRRALPLTGESRPDLEQAYVAPRDQLEDQLVTLWTNVLQLKPIGVRDNFFELGGNSLLAARLFAQIENRFGKHLPLATLFQFPSIEQLANFLRGSDTSKPWSSLVAIQPEGSKPPLFCVHAAGANVLIYRPLSRHLGNDQPVYALQAQGLDGQARPLTRVEDMAALYIREMRALQPEGPYFLLGASFGGLVVYEMAQQLRAQDQEVGLLAMLNTNCPVYSLRKRIRCHLGHLMELGPRVYAGNISKTVKRRLTRQAVEENNGSAKSGTPDPDIQKLLANDSSVDESLVRTVVAILAAEEQYVPTRQLYSGKIILFWARDAEPGFEDNRLAWKRIAAGGFTVHVVPGTHTTMREEPNVAEVVKKLRPYLERA